MLCAKYRMGDLLKHISAQTINICQSPEKKLDWPDFTEVVPEGYNNKGIKPKEKKTSKG